MNFITLDCGASFVKAALFSNGGEMISKVVKQSPFGKNQIALLTSLVSEIFDELLKKSSDKVCLCISNEMHGFLLADADGTPVTDYISWQKEYGRISTPKGSACDILSDSDYREEIFHTGMPLRGGLPSVNLLYLRETGQLNFDKPAYFYTLGDYLIRVLTNSQPNCHLTNAAATGLVDLKIDAWNEKLLDIVSPAQIIFPTIGTTPIEFPVASKKIIVLPAIGDQQAALYGANLTNSDELSFNMGTGGQVSKIISRAEFSTDYQVRPFLNGNYIKTIPHLPCGRALNVYLRFFDDVLKIFDVSKDKSEIWQKLLDAEKISDDHDIRCDLSFFENASTKKLTGSIENIGEYSLTAGNLIRSAFNQLADNFLAAAKKLNNDSTAVKKVLFSGGVARKIESIRKRILENYESIDYEIASDETLKGLFRYGLKMN